MSEENNKLSRSRTDRILFGVCGGLAKYFNVDPTIVRVIFILLVLTPGAGVLLYIVLAILMPLEPITAAAGDPQKNAQEFFNDVGQKAKDLAGEFKGDGQWRHTSRNFFGLLLVVLGLVFLANQFTPFLFLSGRIVWPSLIILLGLFLIVRGNRK